MKQVNEAAKQQSGPGETRTMDQRRADILIDILDGTTGTPGAGGGVDIITDLVSLAGLSDASGDLNGYGPVIADIARQVADQQQDTKWPWTITHPDTGQPLHTGITRRRPNTRQQRIARTRNRSCVFPGCRMPSTQCDLDHTKPWAEGGPTEIDNLAPLCRYHHNIKHRHGWTYTTLPNGDHLFTSKTGHTYTTTGQSP